MATTKTLLRSFAGGEITPELASRVDLTKFQTGLGYTYNVMTLPHGPAVRRPGTQFVNECFDSAHEVRLIPFTFSSNQTVVVEMGHEYFRFHTDGGTVIEDALTITGVTSASPAVVSYSGDIEPADGDWFFLLDVGGMAALNSRWVKAASVDTEAGTFAITDLWGDNIDTTGLTYTSGGSASRAYTLASDYQSDDLFDFTYTQNADVITLAHPSYPLAELARLGSASWSLTDVDFSPIDTVPTGVTAAATVAQSQYLTTDKYCVTAVASDGITETLASSIASCSNNLGLAGNYNTITWSELTGYSRYNVYKLHGGIYGYIGNVKLADGLTLTDDNITPDTAQSPPEDIIALNSGAGDYPGAVSYHEQRRWMAGTDNKPQVFFCTRTATEYNLTSSIPSRSDDSMELRIAAGQYNRILHLVPLSDLLAFTAGGFFRIYADNAPSLTPTSISIKPQSYVGASSVSPVVTSASVLYPQAQGSHVREVAYDWQSAAFKSNDVSILAPHLFVPRRIKQMAFTQAPDPVLWCVCDDGKLLGMTYVPEQQVYGWHYHGTLDGDFSSVCSVTEDYNDVLYMVAARTVDGRSVKYIERMPPRHFDAQEDAFFVDSGLTYSGTATGSVSGAHHLRGKTVAILADGAVVSSVVVGDDGSITLPEGKTASTITYGIPMTSRFTTLPLAIEQALAYGTANVKNVNKVFMRVLDSSVISAGPSFDKLREYPARAVTDPYGSPPGLRTTTIELPIDGAWARDGVVCVEQALPLPLSVLSMVLEVSTGG